MRLSRSLAALAAAALPLVAAVPAAAAPETPGLGSCAGTYWAIGSAGATCDFVYLGGSVTVSVSVDGPLGHKYATIGLYPGGWWCEDEKIYDYHAGCGFTVTPNVAVGTVMTCSSAGVGRPYATVTYSCTGS